VPVGGQVEQVVNGRWLQHLGYGRTARAIEADVLREFLAAVPSCEEQLAQYEQDGNRALFDALDAELEKLLAAR
jgi:hypothetical protein